MKHRGEGSIPGTFGHFSSGRWPSYPFGLRHLSCKADFFRYVLRRTIKGRLKWPTSASEEVDTQAAVPAFMTYEVPLSLFVDLLTPVGTALLATKLNLRMMRFVFGVYIVLAGLLIYVCSQQAEIEPNGRIEVRGRLYATTGTSAMAVDEARQILGITPAEVGPGTEDDAGLVKGKGSVRFLLCPRQCGWFQFLHCVLNFSP